MGGVVKTILKPLMPSVPAMPAIPEQKPVIVEAPKVDDAERILKIAEKRASIRRNRKGRSSTILTTADGLEDDEITTKKTLLGG